MKGCLFMKCEKCNEREANFFYTSNINGNVTKRCLCSQCAAEEGLASDNMLGDFFRPFEMRSPFGMLGSFWNDDFFAPFSRLAAPTMERVRIAEPQEDKNIPDDAGAAFKAKRELVQLKQELKKAVKDENFEKAIELRDKIRSMEQNG